MHAYQNGELAHLVYADDTLLLASRDDHLNEFMTAVAAAGKRYGMELHWDKFQLLEVQCHSKVLAPDGSRIIAKEGMSYLGTIVNHDGLPGHELNRRIGLAKADFLTFSTVWKQSGLTRKRKLDIYISLVESKLLYSLGSLCLSAAEKRRFDGFQCRCLRKIMGIPSAFLLHT